MGYGRDEAQLDIDQLMQGEGTYTRGRVAIHRDVLAYLDHIEAENAALVAEHEAVGAACAECLDQRHPQWEDASVGAFCRDGVGCRFANTRAAHEAVDALRTETGGDE